MSLLQSKAAYLTINRTKASWTYGESKLSLPLAFDNNNLDFAELKSSLLKQIKTRSGSKVTINLNSGWIRFLILPWQAHLFAEQDWLALAKNQFKTVYGNHSAAWEIKLAFQGYGNPVIATAVDQYLCHGFDQIAEELGWKLVVMQPSFIDLSNQFCKKERGNCWLLMIEQDLIVLFEAKKGIWQKVSMASIPVGQTDKTILRLVQQAMVRNAESTDTTKIYVFDSAGTEHRDLLSDFGMESKTLRPDWQVINGGVAL